jgi:hypothetical protein
MLRCSAAAAVLLTLTLFSFNSVSGNVVRSLELNLMKNLAQSKGAVCLDGSPAAFYFANASSADHANDWQIYFEGGGWCYDEMDCFGRSQGNLGSSVKYPATMNLETGQGILSPDCSDNPDFCNFNRVYMKYCDGNSFSGNRDTSVVVNSKPLYFRGRRVLDAVLETLVGLGITKAENVLLTGCSAGGLSTYLHVDYVHSWFNQNAPSMKKFRAAPISGFFLQHSNLEGKPVYPTQMKNIYTLANSTHGLNSACISSFAPEDQWQCNFAQNAYAHATTSIFALNSALDSWQTVCIYTSELPTG